MRITDWLTLLVVLLLFIWGAAATIGYYEMRGRLVKQSFICLKIGYGMAEVGYSWAETEGALEVVIGPKPEKEVRP